MPSRRKKQRMWLKTVILSLTVILACFCCSCGKKEESVPQKDASSDVVESVDDSQSAIESIDGSEQESGEENGREESPSVDDNELPIITDPDLD